MSSKTPSEGAKGAAKRAAKYRGTPRWTSLGDKLDKDTANLTKTNPPTNQGA